MKKASKRTKWKTRKEEGEEQREVLRVVRYSVIIKMGQIKSALFEINHRFQEEVGEKKKGDCQMSSPSKVGGFQEKVDLKIGFVGGSEQRCLLNVSIQFLLLLSYAFAFGAFGTLKYIEQCLRGCLFQSVSVYCLEQCLRIFKFQKYKIPSLL